jgi:hypothetical protein
MTKIPDTLLGEVLDEKLPQHPTRPRRNFEPWHKPRKQFVRRHQWLAEAVKICDSLQFKDDRPLKYLSLPGEDLLDVRVIRECCDQKEVSLKYLGLNESHSSADPDTWLHLAWNEVNSLAGINRNSIVIRDRFELIADRDSQAFQYIEQYGPFDVVNVDLCESISAPEKKKLPNYYSALKALADYQIKNRTEPWLLLVTSRVGDSRVAPTDMEKLMDCLSSNARQYEGFRKRLIQLVPKTNDLIKNKLQTNKLTQNEFVKMFSAGLGKWLLALMSSSVPKWGVLLQSGYSYRVHDDDPDMVSYAFLLEPFIQGPIDTTGLSRVAPSKEKEFDEEKSAIDILNNVGAIQDLDAIVRDKPTLKKQLEEESENLLVAAGYEGKAYKRWLKT